MEECHRWVINWTVIENILKAWKAECDVLQGYFNDQIQP